MDYITIDGKRYAWDYILKVRRKQKRKRWREPQELTLFELRTDCRPSAERTVSGRYLEPTLFSLME